MIIDWSDKGLYNEKYLPLLKDKKRYNILVGGGGSGKSVFSSQREIINSYKKGNRCLCVRKVKDTLKDSMFGELKQRIIDYGLGGHFKITESPMYIQNVKSGSDFVFRGVDDAEKLKSVTGVTRCWIEEATEISKKDFDQIDLRLRGNKELQITMTLNPIDEDHWINKEYWEKGENENVTLLHTTFKDNRWAGEQYEVVMERLKETNSNYYEIYALGKWGTRLEGLVFKSFETIEASPNAAKFQGYGLDFGYTNDPTALVGLWTVGDHVYFQEFIYSTGLTNDDIADRMDDIGIDKNDEIFADSAEPKSIEELCRRGYNVKPAKKGKDSIIYGIDLIKQHTLYIVDSSINLMKELRNYQWMQNKDGVYLNKPIDDFNHAIDACRYVMMGKKSDAKERNLSDLKRKVHMKRSNLQNSHIDLLSRR